MCFALDEFSEAVAVLQHDIYKSFGNAKPACESDHGAKGI